METRLAVGVSVARWSAYRYKIPHLVTVALMGGTVQVTVQLTHLVMPVSYLVTLPTVAALGACMTNDATSHHLQGERARLQIP